MHLKLPIKTCEEFQDGYFAAFPELAEWHLEVIARIQREGVIVTRMGRERRFWGRPDDAVTHREAIAYEPQSLVGDVMNEGLIQVQEWLMKECREARTFIGRSGKLIPFTPSNTDMRAQVHDAGVFLVPIDGVDFLAKQIQTRLSVPVDFGSMGKMVIPSDVMVGRRWNKAPKKSKNGDRFMGEGLVDFKPLSGQKLHWLQR
jgi:DNA polymerase I - 3''-5'' exonuclease and polymerase domains